MLFEFVNRIAVNKITLSGCLSMQVEEGEVPSLRVAMHNDSPHRVDRAVLLWRRVYVAPVEIDTVDIHSKVPPGHTIRIEDWEDVEDKVVPKYSA